MGERNRSSGFYSCDWGTSSFRLRLVEEESGQVLAEVADGTGVRALHELAMSGGTEPLEQRRAALFEKHLLESLVRLESLQPESARIHGGPRAPILLSGMASSQIGWKNLPYAGVPFPIDGSKAERECFTIANDPRGAADPTQRRTVVLISGVCTDRDVLRGEETELVGLFNRLGGRAPAGGALVILPGTHSKHLRVQGEALVDWTTYMTGEFFELAATRSILAATTEWPPQPDGDDAAFEEGVKRGAEEGVLAASFGARTRAVLHQQPKRANTAYLSGVFLGSELASLSRPENSGRVILAASEKFRGIYQKALEILGVHPRLDVAPSDQLKEGSILAHRQWRRQMAVAPEGDVK